MMSRYLIELLHHLIFITSLDDYFFDFNSIICLSTRERNCTIVRDN